MKTGHLSRFDIEPTGIAGLVDRRHRKAVSDIFSGDPTSLPEGHWEVIQTILVNADFSRGVVEKIIGDTRYTITMQASHTLEDS